MHHIYISSITVLVVNYLCEKATSWVFDSVLKMPGSSKLKFKDKPQRTFACSKSSTETI